MKWTYQGKEFTDDMIGDYVGFVYIVEEVSTGMKYIGQKRFKNKITKPPLKGKTRKRKYMVESNWKDYFGSSEKVNQLLEEHGPEAFKREIIHLCKSHGEMNYLELHEQVTKKVLFSDEYYNGIIQVRINSSHVKNVNPDKL